MYFGPVVYVLHVQLEDVEPPIWRRVVVNEDTKLPKLSKILEAAMGWEGYHLYDFQVGDGVTFAGPDSDHAIDERKVTVQQILPRVGSTLTWQYDYGDSWNHTVTVEERNEPDPKARYPLVLDGARACPPEDCGGTGGYERLLESLADPADPEHDDMIQWAPDGYDPEAFDIRAHDAAVRKQR